MSAVQRSCMGIYLTAIREMELAGGGVSAGVSLRRRRRRRASVEAGRKRGDDVFTNSKGVRGKKRRRLFRSVSEKASGVSRRS